MKKLIGGLLGSLAVILLRNYRRLSLDLLKIQATIYYVQGIRAARKGFVAGLMLAVCLLMGGCGFVLVHIGLFLLVPWPWNAIAFLMLGSLYMVVVAFVLRRLCSERTWMEFSNAGKYMEKLTTASASGRGRSTGQA